MDSLVGGVGRGLLSRERTALNDLQVALAEAELGPESVAALRTAQADLDGLFLLVVAGEYNAGKSSLVNALLRATVMPEGVTPTTDRITVLGYGAEEERIGDDGVAYRRAEVPALRDLALVDTPGTNAVIERHQELTERFVPRADLVLFVTSADRPFAGSERAFLDLIASWGKKIVMVVNKIDLLEEEHDRAEVADFVRRHAREALREGIAADDDPTVFVVSARAARRARAAGDEAALEASGLPRLERFVAGELSDVERLRLKLANPLGVGTRLAADAKVELTRRLGVLDDDRATLRTVERQREQFEREIRREAKTYLARVKTTLLEVERRGEAFLDRTVRFGNVLKLMRPERVQADFEAEVIRDVDREIDRAMDEMVDWFLKRTRGLWEDVTEFVQERRKADDPRIVGEVGGRFRLDRRELLSGMTERAESVLSGWDQQAEARRLADSLQQAVVRTGLLQVSGVGLGAALVAFLSGTALDVTGITVGLAVVGVGALVLPRRRHRAKQELHAQLQELRDGLERSLDAQLDRELERAAEDLAAAIAPYTRFVRSERDRLGRLIETLERSEAELAELRREARSLRSAEASDGPAA